MKKIVRLTESDLVRIVKKVINEQNENKVVTLKQLNKMGYDYAPGTIPPTGKLKDSGVSSVGQTKTASEMTLMANVRNKNIPSTNRDGMVFYKTLDNGNIETKWILIDK